MWMGKESYRKMETRLIVARPDIDVPGCPTQNTALFGTYLWNDDETQATLLTDPQRNGEPFTDAVLEYTTNEPLAQAISAKRPRNLTYELESQGTQRHYAVPGSPRRPMLRRATPPRASCLRFHPTPDSAASLSARAASSKARVEDG